MIRFRNGKFLFSVVSCLVALSAANASADNKAVVKRLKTYADLSESDARAVMEKVALRMKVAADVSNTRDPLRTAVSQALYDTTSPENESELSMVRLRLYAGLTQWALDNLFASRTAVTSICSVQSELGAEDCRALLAAAQSVPLEDISPLRLNPRPPPEEAVAVAAPARVARANYGSAPVAPAVRPQAPAARAQAPARSTPVPSANAASVAQRKAEYARQREEYLARRRQEMEVRKAKLMAVAGGERARRGPASQEEAEVVGLAGSSPHDSGSPALVASRSSGPRTRNKPASDDSDLLDGLMDDPLGKSE
jgi:hypothetical protein